MAINDAITRAEFQKLLTVLELTLQKVDRIENVVIGDGGRESLVVRLQLVEERLEQARLDREKRAQDVIQVKADLATAEVNHDALNARVEAWKNKAIGVGIALTLFGGLIGTIGGGLIRLGG